MLVLFAFACLFLCVVLYVSHVFVCSFVLRCCLFGLRMFSVVFVCSVCYEFVLCAVLRLLCVYVGLFLLRVLVYIRFAFM